MYWDKYKHLLYQIVKKLVPKFIHMKSFFLERKMQSFYNLKKNVQTLWVGNISFIIDQTYQTSYEVVWSILFFEHGCQLSKDHLHITLGL